MKKLILASILCTSPAWAAVNLTSLEVWVPGAKCEQMGDIDEFADQLQSALTNQLRIPIDVECTSQVKRTNFLGKLKDGSSIEWHEEHKDIGQRAKIEATVRQYINQFLK